MHTNDLYVVVVPRLAIDREADMELGAPQPPLEGVRLGSHQAVLQGQVRRGGRRADRRAGPGPRLAGSPVVGVIG